MGRYIVKLADNKYVEWSTVVDSPVTYIMDSDEVLEYIKDTRQDQDPVEVLNRINSNNHSAMWFGPQTPEELILCNRAGKNESELFLYELIEEFTQ